MRVIDFQKKKIHKMPAAEVESKIKAMRKEDEKLVKGMFEFVDAEGGFFEFTYRMYPGEPIRTFQLIHGEICEIPMGLVKHLNNTKKKITRYKDVEQTFDKGPIKKPRGVVTMSRVRFVPTDYL